MAQSLSLNAASGPGIMECPVCKQTIDATSTECRFCSVAIDPSIVEAAEKEMARTNQACSDASFLRTAAIAVPVFVVIALIPFLGWMGFWGYVFLSIAVPVMAIRWWVKFHGIKARDAEIRRARTTVIVISIIFVFPLIWDFFYFVVRNFI